MTTARLQASRQNGARSNGPVTTNGKARAAQNATKHGLSGGPIVLPHESQEQYDALKNSYLREFSPASAAERDLVEEMVASRWRLRRIEFMETALINKAIEEQFQSHDENLDLDTAMVFAFADLADNSKGLRMIERYQRTLRRGYERAQQELRQMQERRAAQNEPETEIPEIPALIYDKLPDGGNAFVEAVMPYVAEQEQSLGRLREHERPLRRAA